MTQSGTLTPIARTGPPRFVSSAGFSSWLAETGCALAVSTYETGKLLLLGRDDRGGLALFDRTIPRCTGLHAQDGRLHVASQGQVLRFCDAGPEGKWDRRFLPRMSWFTGAVDAHDLAVDGDGCPVLVATEFNAVVRASPDHSFEALWWPALLGGPIRGDRCHVNGLAMEDGEPAVVTMAGRSAHIDGWRSSRLDGGEVVRIQTDEVLAAGLSMPHSPRIHDGKVWFLESGRGRLCVIEAGEVRTVAELPGFARGLSFIGGYAVVGLSAPRSDDALKDLPLHDLAARRGTPLRCGIAVVDLSTGTIAHEVVVEGAFHEVYDVVVLRDTVRPMAVGFRGDEIHRTFHIATGQQRMTG